MARPALIELPPPPEGATGWPWTTAPTALADAPDGGTEWPKISIVTPSYNQGDYLEQTIRSVLLQGYANLEYVIIDGGSTDASVAIIRKYEPWLSYWVSAADRGQSHAINKGFERCSGDLITFQNSDDLYLPGAFADVGRQWPALAGHGAIIGAFHYLDGAQIRPAPIPARLPHPGPIDLAITPSEAWRLHQVSAFYVGAALDQVGRWVREDLHYTMDRELLYRVCRAYPVRLSDRAYGAFRWHDEGKTVSHYLRADLEFSDLHLSYHYPTREQEAMKRKVARQRRAKGYMRFARHQGVSGRSILALIRAAVYQPDLLRRVRYLKAWVRALGLMRLRPGSG
ncbi:MAG TPA: glycosyltransferase family 2 protein [Acidobacteriota bacterium]